MAFRSAIDEPHEGSYFDGGVLQLMGYRLLAGLLTIVTLGIAFPWALCMLKRWEARHTVIGNRRLEFDGHGLQLLGIWIVLALLGYGLLIAAYPAIWLARETRSTALNLFILICFLLGLALYSTFVSLQIKKWEVAYTTFDSRHPASSNGLPPARAPFRLTSKDLAHADGMIEYCNYFDFSNSVGVDIREHLFRVAEPYISPDGEVVMTFAAALGGTAGNSCVCAFGATRFIIAAEDGVDVVPVADIRGFSLEDRGLISVVILQLRDRDYTFGVDKGRATALLNTCRASLKACQAEIRQKAAR